MIKIKPQTLVSVTKHIYRNYGFYVDDDRGCIPVIFYLSVNVGQQPGAIIAIPEYDVREDGLNIYSTNLVSIDIEWYYDVGNVRRVSIDPVDKTGLQYRVTVVGDDIPNEIDIVVVSGHNDNIFIDLLSREFSLVLG